MKKISLMFVSVIATTCGNFALDPPSSLKSSALISDCYGLDASQKQIELGIPDDDTYCDAEVLHWSFNDAARRLTLLDARIVLNCCGEHDMYAERIGRGAYLITETDAPMKIEDGGYDRCLCTCVFDYQLYIEDIDTDRISIQLVRDIEENDDIIDVFEGELVLTEKSGSLVIDETDVGAFCDPIE
jgi:hypothetical protein